MAASGAYPALDRAATQAIGRRFPSMRFRAPARLLHARRQDDLPIQVVTQNPVLPELVRGIEEQSRRGP